MSLWIPWQQADQAGRLLLVAALGFSAWAGSRAFSPPQEPADPQGSLPLDRVAAQAVLLWLGLLTWNLFADYDFTERLLNGLAALLSLWFAAALVLRLRKRIQKEHWFYDWSWSGFSAVWLALIIRGTLIEAYSIPSESMVPTLLISDHLFVSKTTFGWHIPFTHGRIFRFRDVRRGEIVIFIPPNDPKVSYVKRCVGLPGDTIEVRDKQVYIDGKLSEVPYSYGRLNKIPLASQPPLVQARDAYMKNRVPQVEALQAAGKTEQAQAEARQTTWLGPFKLPLGSYYLESAAMFVRAYGRLADMPKVGSFEVWPKTMTTPAEMMDWGRDHHMGNRDWFGPYTLKPGEYWMMGDNRDNSSDSRYFGPVREEALRGTPLLRYWPLDRVGRLQ